MSMEFDQLFLRYYDLLIATTRRRLPPGLGEAEDFVHLAYLRCRKNWSAERQSLRSSIAYFARAVRWSLIDAVRRAQRHCRNHREYARVAPQWSIPQTARLQLGEALKTLSSRQRDLGLALIAGKTTTEIQAELNLSKSACAVGICRLRRSIERRMK